ncbi:MAG: serine acetyltransferase [Marinilabiliales bacterium]|nr:MAG: serine acetyltransferase [Marinilabiliales bacterium]
MDKLDPFIDKLFDKHRSVSEFLPDINETQEFTDRLIRLLFPNYPCDRKEQYRMRFRELEVKLEKLMILLDSNMEGDPYEQSRRFFEEVPVIYTLLVKDAEAICRFDPAVTSLQEVICAYPGFYAIAVYRFANLLYRRGVPLLPRIMTEYAHGKTGIDIHPGATIGKSFFIDHGTGVVIGETTIIGDNVKIYQGVTLGALVVKKSMAAKKRHPTIEDNVVIYAGSTVLGGETTIGHDSVIGGNVWLTESVPAHSVVYHTSTVKIRNSKDKGSYDDFSI